MSLKSWIAKFIPQSWLLSLQLRRDQQQLSTVDDQACDTSQLASWTAADIEQFWREKDILDAWEIDSRQLKAFEIPDMTGGVNPGDRQAIYFLAKALKVGSVLEVGTHVGASTVHIALAIKSNQEQSPSSDSRLDTVDIANVNDSETKPWLKYGATHSPAEMLQALGCHEFANFHTAKSLEYLQSCQRKYDLIFLDGDHSAKTTYLEIPLALRLLNPGGSILLHDYFPDLKPLWSNRNVIHGPFLAVDRLVNQDPCLQVLPLGDLPWPTKLGSHRTSLALVTSLPAA